MSTPAAAGAAFTGDDGRQMLESIQKWLEREVRPKVATLEHADAYPAELVEQMKAFGLFGATIAREYGGLGMPAAIYARLVTLIS
jgi:alkylation response protein AidB-like acyl-CoA dehydrogenase